MENTKTKNMDLNRETAMRLWDKSFGNVTKTIDFSGREMAKGAYNDRNSSKGWNVDHVLPQSRGGATADYNLVCCNIQTNDEKADSFPCFVANGKRFEIVKVQNHYEIRNVEEKSSKQQKRCSQDDDNVDFLDSAAGLRYFKKLKGIQNKKRWVGTVNIRLGDIQNNAVIDFIEKLFKKENVSFDSAYRYQYAERTICVKDYDMPLKSDINNLLDKCVLLNTYLESYFEPVGYVNGYEIQYSVECFENKDEMYDTQKRNVRTMNALFPKPDYQNTLLINQLVYLNSEASKKEAWDDRCEFNIYNYCYKELSNNLKKEADKE